MLVFTAMLIFMNSRKFTDDEAFHNRLTFLT